MYGVEAPITRLQTTTGVKDKVAQHCIDILLQKSREMKANNPGRSAESIKEELEAWLSDQPGDKVNPLLDIAGLDPHRDTPVEILHTILLGIIKYVWYTLHSGWSEAQRDLFVIRLQSTDISGLKSLRFVPHRLDRKDIPIRLRDFAFKPWLEHKPDKLKENEQNAETREVGDKLWSTTSVVAINHGDEAVVEEGNANGVLKVRTCSVAEDKPKPAQAQAVQARTANFKLR
ncbi:hypothetical protein B0H14DRAFT_2587760 [Mycena olivaceomarginata]|nr:hypothetical protein B0H14DRAFT_2587760 [Mycena olivaceomarginata]